MSVLVTQLIAKLKTSPLAVSLQPNTLSDYCRHYSVVGSQKSIYGLTADTGTTEKVTYDSIL